MSTAAAPVTVSAPGNCTCARSPAATRAIAYPPTAPADVPVAAMTTPSPRTAVSRCLGADPTAGRMPNSRVQDLRLVLDTIERGPIVLMGTSLGAAVALQEAGEDDRIAAVVAAETFSDLRTVAIERAPFFFTIGTINRAFEVAEADGHFAIEAVSPMAAARTIAAPVLLIHGATDQETPPAHSRRVFEALHGRKQLILVPNAGHNQSLRGEVWADIDRWIEGSLVAPAELR